MNLDWGNLLEHFVTMWVIINPIGKVPIFLAVTKGIDQKKHSTIAVQAVLVSAGILFFFIVLGQVLLDGLGISLASFRIAGSIVLFLFGLKMIFGSLTSETNIQDDSATDQNVAIFPLAVPAIAGPGAMLAVVLLTDNHRFSIPEQVLTTATVIVVLAMTLVLLLLAKPIYKVIGEGGASIVSRVMGMFLAAIAVDGVLDGLVVGIEQRFLLSQIL